MRLRQGHVLQPSWDRNVPNSSHPRTHQTRKYRNDHEHHFISHNKRTMRHLATSDYGRHRLHMIFIAHTTKETRVRTLHLLPIGFLGLLLAFSGCGSTPPPTCNMPQISCNGACISASDDANCGGCQRACSGGNHCMLGQCVGSQDLGCTTDGGVRKCCRKTAGECPALGQTKCLVSPAQQCCNNSTRPWIEVCTIAGQDGSPTVNSTQGCDVCVSL